MIKKNQEIKKKSRKMPKIKIPSGIVGSFIGKGGSGIKNFSSKFPKFRLQIQNEGRGSQRETFVELSIPKRQDRLRGSSFVLVEKALR